MFKKVISDNPEGAFRQGVDYGLAMAGEIIREMVRQGANRIFVDYADEFNSVTVPDGYDQVSDPDGYMDFESYRAPELLTPQAVKVALDTARDAIAHAAKEGSVPLDAEKFGRFAGKWLTDAKLPDEGATDHRVAELVRKSVEPGKLSWDEGIVIDDKEKPKPKAAPKP